MIEVNCCGLIRKFTLRHLCILFVCACTATGGTGNGGPPETGVPNIASTSSAGSAAESAPVSPGNPSETPDSAKDEAANQGQIRIELPTGGSRILNMDTAAVNTESRTAVSARTDITQIDPVSGIIYVDCTFEMTNTNPRELSTGLQHIVLGNKSGDDFTPAVRFGLTDHKEQSPGKTLIASWANDGRIDYYGGYCVPQVPCDFRLKLDLPQGRLSVRTAQRGTDRWLIVAEGVPLANAVQTINEVHVESFPGAMGISEFRISQEPWPVGEQIRPNPLAKQNRVVKQAAGFQFQSMRSVWQSPDRHVTIQRAPPRWYGFPDVVQTGPDSLAVCYNDGAGHGGGGAAFVKLSHDWGKSWGEPITVHPSGVNCPRIQKLNDGSLLLLADIHGSYPVVFYESQDGGQTWSNQRFLQPKASGGTLAAVPSHLLEMPDKSWLLFASSWHPLKGDEWQREWLELYRSQDRGQTWNLHAPQIKTYPPRILSEPDPVILPDGRLFMMVRESRGDGWPATKAFSSDAGQTWDWHFLPFNISGRVCLGLLNDGQAMATFRSHASSAALWAWIGDPADTTQYQAAGAHFNDAHSVGLKDNILHIENDGACGQFTRYSLRSFHTPQTELDLTFEAKVLENSGRGATFSIPFVGKLRLYPDHAEFAHAKLQYKRLNPDPFDSYAPTDDWQPEAAAHGWTRGGNSHADARFEITAADGYQGTKGLRPVGGDAWPCIASWYGVPNTKKMPTQLVRWNARIPTPDPSWGNRFQGFAIHASTGYPNVIAWLQVRAEAGTPQLVQLLHGKTAPGVGETHSPLPGSDLLKMDTWYTFEMEYDYASQRVRGRYGLADGSQPMFDWTDWKWFCQTGTPDQVIVQGKYVDIDNLEIPGASHRDSHLSFAVEPDRFHTYRVVSAKGAVQVYLDGNLTLETDDLHPWPTKASSRFKEYDQSGHLFSFGNEELWENSLSEPGNTGTWPHYLPTTSTGYSQWKRVSMRQQDPAFGEYEMSWSAEKGFPDQYQLDHMIEIEGSVLGADQGYSGWVQREDGSIFVVNYSDDTAKTLSSLYGTSWIRGTWLTPDDLPPKTKSLKHR